MAETTQSVSKDNTFPLAGIAMLVLLVAMAVWQWGIHNIGSRVAADAIAEHHNTVSAIGELIDGKAISDVQWELINGVTSTGNLTITVKASNGRQYTETFSRVSVQTASSTDGAYHIVIDETDNITLYLPTDYAYESK